MVRLIAAINKYRVIGDGDKLIWDIPGDLDRFRRLTKGRPVIMGRKTWGSLPENRRPLPGRTNIVLSRDTDFRAEGAQVVSDMKTALALAKRSPGGEEIYVIGGSAIFELALPYADQLDLTFIEDDSDDPSWPHFPPFAQFEVVPNDDPSDDGARTENGITYEFVTLRPASTS